MKMKNNIIRKIGRTMMRGLLAVSLPTALLAGLSGCTDDLFWNGNEDLGEKIHGTLSVPLGPSSPVQASRSVDFSENAMVKIDSYWIGIFDTKTGELIGTKYDEHPRKSDGTRWTLRNDNDTPFTVDDVDIYYYEHNPHAYIVGVVNFNDVMAKKAGEEEATTAVIDYLKDVKQLKDIKDIVIDTKSADKANRDRGSDEANPIMMGFYSTARTTMHTQMNPDGSLYDSPIGIYYNDYRTSDEVVADISGSNGVDINLSEGSIRLQRLLAEVNVYVLPVNEWSDKYHWVDEVKSSHWDDYTNYSRIKGVRYKVMNKPQDVFLVEHAVDYNAWNRTSEADYLANTANSADFTENFLSDEGWNYASYYYDDYYGASGYRFTYQHYENKHVGNYWWNYTNDYFDGNDHYLREKRYPDETAENGLSEVYRALCPSVDQAWNNNGSYIVVEVEFEDNKWQENDFYDPNVGYSDYWDDYEKQDAKVYYIIHEGNTRKVNGFDLEFISDPIMDFQTQRNTQYMYELAIGGADGLKMNVNYKDFEEENYHNDGIYGEGSYWKKMVIDNTNKATFRPMDEITVKYRKDLKWIYYMYSPGENGSGSYSKYYGNWTAADGDLYYDSSEGPINVRNIWDPTNYDPSLPPHVWTQEDYKAWNMLMSSVWVTKTNNIDRIEEAYQELMEWLNEWEEEWFKKWEEEHPDYQDDPSQYPDFDEFMEEFMKDYMEKFPGEKMKYMPLYYFIQTSDDDPMLRLSPGEQFYYCFSPYLVTETAGDDTNYEKLTEYKRQFFIMEPKRTDGGDCTILANTQQFVQHPYDDRISLSTMYLDNIYSIHDRYLGGIIHDKSGFDYETTQWCGAPGTVTWITLEQYYYSNDPNLNNDEISVPSYEVTIGNKTYYVDSKDVKEIYNWGKSDRVFAIPIYIEYNNELGYNSSNGTNYGYFDVTVQTKPNPKYYRPVSPRTQPKGLFVQRQNTGASTGTWQWLFSNVSESTYGWSKHWAFYNNSDNMYNTDFEFGGLTIVNRKGTDVSSRKAISTAKYPLLDRVNDDDVTQVDCLTFGGGYGTKAPSSRSNDAMMLKFWVDRPGDIYLSFGYNGYAANREWRAYWRSLDGSKSSTQYLYWPNIQAENNHVIPERKGQVNSGTIDGFWPDVNQETGKFIDGPIEICIYMASSGGYIRSIEFRPN